jgi:hypothetical protein
LTSYCKAEHPSIAQYGEATWQDKIKKASLISQFMSITEMVEHIVAELARVFEGTTHIHNWMFYHDALALSTAKYTIVWMKEVKGTIKNDGYCQSADCWRIKLT